MQDLIIFSPCAAREKGGAFSIMSKFVGANRSIDTFIKSDLVLFLTKNSITMSNVKISTIASISKGSYYS